MAEATKTRKRQDRTKVLCLKCFSQLNKDNMVGHWKNRHPEEYNKGIKPQYRLYGSGHVLERSSSVSMPNVSKNLLHSNAYSLRQFFKNRN